MNLQYVAQVDFEIRNPPPHQIKKRERLCAPVLIGTLTLPLSRRRAGDGQTQAGGA